MIAHLRHVTVNGVSLGYDVRGEASGGTPVVFVHGYGGRSTGEETYGELIGALAENFTVYALDLRGHGGSAAAEGWSLPQVADDVAAFVQALGLRDALYVGHSIGGFTGMFCAVRHPGTFAALALIATASAEGGKSTPPEVGQMHVEHGQDAEFLRGAVAAMYLGDADIGPHVAAAMLVDRKVHETFFAEYPEQVIIDAVGSIEVPVLALNGALDNIVPLATQHATAMAIPNCKEVVFTTEGHMLPIEAPLIVAREIVAFWREDRDDTFAGARRRARNRN